MKPHYADYYCAKNLALPTWSVPVLAFQKMLTATREFSPNSYYVVTLKTHLVIVFELYIEIHSKVLESMTLPAQGCHSHCIVMYFNSGEQSSEN